VAFSPDSDRPRLASASVEGTVRIWDVKTGAQIVNPPLHHTAGARCVAFSQDGRFLASGGSDHVVKVWDTQTWKLFDERPELMAAVQCVEFHPKESSVLAWGGRDSTVRVWKVGTKEIHTLHGHQSWVLSVAFSPDGEWLASASLDGTVRVWKTPSLLSPRLGLRQGTFADHCAASGLRAEALSSHGIPDHRFFLAFLMHDQYFQ
jgi:WD40 repeat protein